MAVQSENARGKVDGETELAQEMWYAYLTGDESRLPTKVKVARQVMSRLPGDPHCKVCSAPFSGIGRFLVALMGFGTGRSGFTPHLCGRCEQIVKRHEVGTEVQLAVLFADVRGSTPLAEAIGSTAYHGLINRFYKASTEILVGSDALVDKLVGDEIIGLYLPGIAGPEYVQKAIDAAEALLRATGHADPTGPWISVGAGVHVGTAYVGAVGSSKGVSDITVLGDTPNTGARLASQAEQGEVLVSEDACHLTGMPMENGEGRTLALKGRSAPLRVRVVRVASA